MGIAVRLINMLRSCKLIIFVVEFAFGGWGEPPLPRDFTDIKDYLMTLEAEEPVPSWLIEMADILLECKEPPASENSKYRMYMLSFFSPSKANVGPLQPSSLGFVTISSHPVICLQTL